jgi:hypothetical protein
MPPMGNDMTDYLAIARECDAYTPNIGGIIFRSGDGLSAFAERVRQDERERCARRGWKLLRRMPNVAMVEAGREAMSPEQFVSHCRTLLVWNAMWDAAPNVADSTADYVSASPVSQQVPGAE